MTDHPTYLLIPTPSLYFSTAFPARLQPGSRLEFVINDGGSDWDKPGHGASNYVAVEPGTYRVKNGKLTRLA